MTKKILIFLTFLLLTAALAACAGQSSLHAPPLYAPVAARVDTAAVTRGPVQRVYVLNGIVRAETDAVRLEAGSGPIGTIYAWPGDLVEEGQLLARLDAAALENTIEARQEAINFTQTLFELQQREMSLELDILRLTGDDTVRIRWLELEINHLRRRHNRQMDAEREALRELADNLEYTEIRATAAGEVIYAVRPGTWVNTGDAVMYIALPGNVFVEYIGQESLLFTIANSMKLQGIVDGRAFDLEQMEITPEQRRYYSALRRLPIPRRLTFLDTSYDLPEAGKSVFIRFYTVWVEDTLRIPGNALFNDQDGASYVFRLEDGAWVPVYVEVGRTTGVQQLGVAPTPGFYTEILEGLYEGDVVLVRP